MSAGAGSVLCCPDKFRGSLTAAQAAAAMAAGVSASGLVGRCLPLADGGEGTLDALLAGGGERRRERVTGPLGDPVEAEWGLLPDGTAVVEMARASGLALVEGRNDPLRATTFGTGELIRAASASGARRVIVAVGGSATVDGGLGALEALGLGLGGTEVVVACDVTTSFCDCAAVYGPQKGATPEDVVVLEARLEELRARYLERFGIDVEPLTGAGAAGGLAGGLAAAGASLVAGAALVAEVAGLERELAGCVLALTGEGKVDATSFAGKAVGHVLERACAAGVEAAVIAGDVDRAAVPAGVRVESLVERTGSVESAIREAEGLVEQVAAELASGSGSAAKSRSPRETMGRSPDDP